ncbi:ciliary microtubule associated protein 1B [Latimeria chalumnae]|uniref:Ciliary microtubule associated protein 1A n=1 Tax=Latimeria chalumnae TaxID=7897 RepID=H3A4P2_LATCH|nr:PREDICTED: outer dense fiber protein 3-like [Latimeria chalumnae]|eukprot:XP_006012962.1 PREDICTED: outer dense fiber protein 3-like [Latimeria chalumnae]
MATDVWVGTWRPHRPRGPIAALYSSPGPKYLLPSETGHVHHDVTKLKAPAFSFGLRHCNLTDDCSPGPGYLVPANMTMRGKDGTPAYSIYSRPKDLELFKTPGPGRYSPEKAGKSAYYSPPAYSLAARTKLFKSDQSPGPAAYVLPSVLGPRVVNKSSAPNYSLVGRSKIGGFHEDLQKSPGPGTYRVTDPNIYKFRNPLYSMTARNAMPGDTTQKPGPGAHSPEKVTLSRRAYPNYSFGIRHSEYLAPLIVDVPE